MCERLTSYLIISGALRPGKFTKDEIFTLGHIDTHVLFTDQMDIPNRLIQGGHMTLAETKSAGRIAKKAQAVVRVS